MWHQHNEDQTCPSLNNINIEQRYPSLYSWFDKIWKKFQSIKLDKFKLYRNYSCKAQKINK